MAEREEVGEVEVDGVSLTWDWRMPGRVNSTGSSMVLILRLPSC